jgi:hypothetical protein
LIIFWRFAGPGHIPQPFNAVDSKSITPLDHCILAGVEVAGNLMDWFSVEQLGNNFGSLNKPPFETPAGYPFGNGTEVLF